MSPGIQDSARFRTSISRCWTVADDKFSRAFLRGRESVTFGRENGTEASAADETVKFPMSPYFRYKVYRELEEEVNNVFFLFTKVRIPFKGDSLESLVEHIYRIEPQERYLAIEKFRIVQ